MNDKTQPHTPAAKPAFGPRRWAETSSRWLYSALMWALQPLVRRKLARRGRTEPGYLADVEQRFGHYTAVVHAALAPRGGSPRIWLHAVSLGETRAAAILLSVLRQQWPGLQLVLTHGTATGRAEGQRLLQPGDVQLWQPWDTAGATQRFLDQVRPDLGLVMETEVWPNLLWASQRRGLPVALVNARLNDKSMRGALRWPALMAPSYRRFAQVLAQTDADAERLRRVGARQPVVTGNLKYDVEPAADQLSLACCWRGGLARPVVMLASAREGEEAALLDVLQAHADAHAEAAADIQWLIVPRHPQRFEAVAEVAEQRGWRVSRRSSWPATGPDGCASAADDVGPVLWLGDSLGEMALYYALSDLALLGGSFLPLGGQNLIEAAACGCPVLMGPHTFNFAQAAIDAEADGAAERVTDLDAAVVRAVELLRQQPSALAGMRQAAQRFAQRRGGAALRTVQALTASLPPRA